VCQRQPCGWCRGRCWLCCVTCIPGLRAPYQKQSIVDQASMTRKNHGICWVARPSEQFFLPDLLCLYPGRYLEESSMTCPCCMFGTAILFCSRPD
jgi:hypothetical protein